MATNIRRCDGFKPSRHVGQRPADDHAHGIRQVAILHLIVDRQRQSRPSNPAPPGAGVSSGEASAGSGGSGGKLASVDKGLPFVGGGIVTRSVSRIAGLSSQSLWVNSRNSLYDKYL